MVCHCIIWYPLICYDTWYRYMIVFSSFRQYRCKVEKPLRWMSLQNAYILSVWTFIKYIFFPPMAPNGGYVLCNRWKCFQFAAYFECILNMNWIWFRYFSIFFWICLRYGLGSLWYFIVSYGIFWYVMPLYVAIWLCFQVSDNIHVL